MIISEDNIIAAIEKLESSVKGHEKFLDGLDENSVALSYFVFEVDKDLMLPHELDEWFSIGTLILFVLKENGVALPTDEETDILEEIEDKNWTIFEATKGKFREKVSVFFEGYEEEDLLAFVEDMVTGDEEEALSSVARDIIFIKGKTIIDYCIG